MILSKPDIERYLAERRLCFDPEVAPEQIAQVSIDLRLGRKFSTFKEVPGYLSAIRVDPSLWTSADLWQHEETEVFRLEPGHFVLAQTLETVSIPDDLVGMVEGRSSWARVGVTIHVTAPKIDPGFTGTITLEMANFGKATVELRAEQDQPAQLMFFTLSSQLDKADVYGTGVADTFQNQRDPIPHGNR